MRFRDIAGERDLTEERPIKPLTPEQARRQSKKRDAARAKIADTQHANAIRLAAAQRRLTDI